MGLGSHEIPRPRTRIPGLGIKSKSEASHEIFDPHEAFQDFLILAFYKIFSSKKKAISHDAGIFTVFKLNPLYYFFIFFTYDEF